MQLSLDVAFNWLKKRGFTTKPSNTVIVSFNRRKSGQQPGYFMPGFASLMWNEN